MEIYNGDPDDIFAINDVIEKYSHDEKKEPVLEDASNYEKSLARFQMLFQMELLNDLWAALTAATIVLAAVLLSAFWNHNKKETQTVQAVDHKVKTLSEEESTTEPETEEEETLRYPKVSEQYTEIVSENVRSPYVALLDVENNCIIAGKNKDARIYPASMTKVMTLIVAVEHLQDLSQTFTMTADIVDPLFREGASRAGFEAGDTVNMEDMLYGLILPSGADAAVGLANFRLEERFENPVCMPDADAALAAQKLLEEKMNAQDSVGGVVECVVRNLMPGIGEPVFDKLDAKLGQAIFSIGAVKGVEIGAGFAAILALAIFTGKTGIVCKFFNVSLSRSIKNSMAATIPKTIGSMTGSPNVTSSPKTASNPVKFPTLPANTSAVKGIGKSRAAKTTKDTKCLRFSFQNSHLISLSNPLTPCNLFEVILQSVLTEMRFLNVNTILHKGAVNLCYWQSCIIQIQIVTISNLHISSLEQLADNLCSLTCIRNDEVNKLCVLCLQFFQTFFFQQNTTVNNSNVICQ